MTLRFRSVAIAVLAVLAVLAVFALAGAAAPSFAGIVLSSNMDVETTDTTSITNTQWIAAPFRSTSVLTTITDVNLDISTTSNYRGGDLSVEIWTASNAGPTAFMQSIRKSPFVSRPVSITGLSVMLQPNTNYAVVARGNVFNSFTVGGRPQKAACLGLARRIPPTPGTGL
jgi:hypothetical protein